jgi:hypothetical protein
MIRFLAPALGLAIAAAAVWHAAEPRTSPPLKPEVYDSIHGFNRDHPQWRVLASAHTDTTPIAMGHALHMSPDTQRMQEDLRAWVDRLHAAGVPDAQIPVRALATGKLVLTCNACHAPDDEGRYMKPIRYEAHCRQCHDLGGGDDPVPHGRAVVSYVQVRALRTLTEKKPAASQPARRGPAGRTATSAPSDTPLTFASADELATALARTAHDAAARLSARLVQNQCAKCHGQLPEALERADADLARIAWDQIDPRIPDRWLPRSVFSHAAHRAQTCESCHAAAAAPPATSPAAWPEPAWTGATHDIMLPGIDACRACHSDAGHARHDCAECHVFHLPERTFPVGTTDAR